MSSFVFCTIYKHLGEEKVPILQGPVREHYFYNAIEIDELLNKALAHMFFQEHRSLDYSCKNYSAELLINGTILFKRNFSLEPPTPTAQIKFEDTGETLTLFFEDR